MDLRFEIENQKLTISNKEFIVDKSNKYLNLVFDFITDDWADTTKFCILKNNTENYLFPIADNTVNVPYDAVSDDNIRITVYGIKLDDTRITTNEIGLLLNHSGYTTDISNIEDLTPTVAEDLYLKLGQKLNITDIDAELDINSADPVQNKIIYAALNGKSGVDHKHNVSDVLDFPNLANVATSGSYNDLSNKPTVESLGADVTVEQVEATAGYFASYQVLQDGEPVGAKINIPKDYLVKSASIKEIDGKTYIDFVINTKDSTGEDEHLLLDVSTLLNVYEADNSTLVLNNGVFSVKNKGIGVSKLSDDVNTKLGYADNWNSSAAKNISSSDLVYWNGKQDVNNLVTSWGSTLSDSKYPSEKLVKDTIETYIGNINDYIGE